MSAPAPLPGRAWRRFKKNPLAMAGAGFIVVMTLVAMAGALIRPDQTVNANNQQLSLAGKKPGFCADMLRKKTGLASLSAAQTWLAGGSPSGYEEIPVRSATLHGNTVTVVMYDAYGEAPATETFDVSDLVPHPAGGWIHRKCYWLGTDKYGRDLLSRLMAGTVISLSVGLVAVLISLVIGLLLGLLAGYYRGWVDAAIMWFTNVVWAVPTLLLVMAITFAFGTGFWKVFLAVGLTMWVEVARITRGQVLGVREKEYIEAARALGIPSRRIMFRHILPNILSPVIVISAANFASAILIEAGLSFLGLGAKIPVPSWGNIIREHYAYITTDMAYLALAPGVLIMLLVLSFMMVGNGLRDALDVRG